jgi:hypothetical protein
MVHVKICGVVKKTPYDEKRQNPMALLIGGAKFKRLCLYLKSNSIFKVKIQLEPRSDDLQQTTIKSFNIFGRHDGQNRTTRFYPDTTGSRIPRAGK